MECPKWFKKTWCFLKWLFSLIMKCIFLIPIIYTIYVAMPYIRDIINGGELEDTYFNAGVLVGLFSIISLIGVFILYSMQSKGLNMQRKMMKRQKVEALEQKAIQLAEIERQKTETEEQKKLNQLQQFENTFFNMMRFLQEIINELSPLSIPDVLTIELPTGRKLFKHYYEISGDRHARNFTDAKGKIFHPCLKRELEDISDPFSNYDTRRCSKYFGNYFKYMYEVLKYVDDNKKDYLTDIQRCQYISTLQACLSEYELVWLYYHCMFSEKDTNLRNLVIKYTLLQDINISLLAKGYGQRHMVSRIIRKRFKENGEKIENISFDFNDFEYYLLFENKYPLTAFYNKNELEDGLSELRNFLDELKEDINGVEIEDLVQDDKGNYINLTCYEVAEKSIEILEKEVGIILAQKA